MDNNQWTDRTQKAEWQTMKLSFYGKVSSLVQVGNGKTLVSTADPGEYKKVPVQG